MKNPAWSCKRGQAKNAYSIIFCILKEIEKKGRKSKSQIMGISIEVYANELCIGK